MCSAATYSSRACDISVAFNLPRPDQLSRGTIIYSAKRAEYNEVSGGKTKRRENIIVRLIYTEQQERWMRCGSGDGGKRGIKEGEKLGCMSSDVEVGVVSVTNYGLRLGGG